MEEKSNEFLLVYGSETGQAQSIAEQIAEKSSEFGLQAKLHCLKDTGKGVQFNIEEERCMVMVTSTTGDGDPPDNASKFLRQIKKKTLASDYLSQLHYTVLGLGDTNYNNFCKCGRDMDSRLEQLGAKRFYPTGLADDGVGLEIVVDPWLEGFYPALKKHLEKSKVEESIKDPLSQRVTDMKLEDTILENSASQLVSYEYSVNGLNLNGVSIEKDFCDDKTNESNDKVKTANDIINVNNNSSLDSKPMGHSLEVGMGDLNMSLKSSKDKSDLTHVSVCNSDSDCVINGSHTSAVSNSNVTVSKGERTDVDVTSDLIPETSSQIPLRVDKVNSFNGVDGAIPVPGVNSIEPLASDKNSLDINSEEFDTKCVLRNSSPALHERNLTVPVLAPEFLHAEFSQQSVETEKLPFQNGLKLPSSASHIIQATVSQARVLTHPESVKRTLWLRLSLKDQVVKYSPGDSISIICQNNADEVQLLLERLKASDLADRQMCLSLVPDTKKRRAAVPAHIHPTSTLRHVLMTCVSIRDVPSKALLRTLIEYTTDESEKRRLQELCSKEGAEEYTLCLREKGVSLLDILYAFPSCQPPIQRVLEFLTRLLPRPYSICSCPETNPSCLDIVFNIVDIPRDIVDGGHYYSRRGVCTGWLDDITSSLQKSCNLDDKSCVQIPMFFRSNQHFQPPTDLTKPLILIGPGTGVAPFIGFLQQRALLKSRRGTDENYGKTWLFTGCRNQDRDYLFRDDLEDFHATGTLNRLCVSFSRDPDSSYRYVQDYLRSEGESLVRLIVEEEALVYVCGDAKNMSKDVSAAFQEIFVRIKGMSADEASAFIMKKRLHKTYLEDVWT